MIDYKNLKLGAYAQQSNNTALSDLTNFATIYYFQIVDGKLNPVFRLKEKQNAKLDRKKSIDFQGESLEVNVTAKGTPCTLLCDGKWLPAGKISDLALSLGNDLAKYIIDTKNLPSESVVHSKATIIAFPILINRDERNFAVEINSAVKVIRAGTVMVTASDGRNFTSSDEIYASGLGVEIGKLVKEFKNTTPSDSYIVTVGSNNNILVENNKPTKLKELENKKENSTNSLSSPTPPIKTPSPIPAIPLSEREKVIALESEVERLKAQIAQLQNFSSSTTNDVTLLVDDEYLTEIKERSEAYLYEELKKLYPSNQVKWLNYNFATQHFEESYQHHDFEILDNRGDVLHYIDCKATPQQKKTFYLTSNEWDLFLNCIAKGNSYQIYRVYNLETLPKYILIDNLKEWIETGKVVPYLPATETIKGGRVFLTLV